MSKKVFRLIAFAAFCVFLGRAYQLYFFGGSYRAVLWDEDLMSPIVEGIFDVQWYDYATSKNVNNYIELFTKINSIIFLISAVISLFWEQIKEKRLKRLVGIGLVLLVLLGICSAIDKRNDIFQFFEMILQFSAPLALLLIKDVENVDKKRIILWFKIAVALTFLPHGLYALGAIYVPGNFIDMTIAILSVTETTAKQFLLIVGLLDIILSIVIFFPNKIDKYLLMYLAFWGFATAFARIVAGFDSNFPANSIHELSYLTIYRLPHGIIPLCILLLIKNNQNKTINNLKTV
ncbi:hypothetical protein [uncultured Polaribacter sp.]|uniref:hypothetical protein n=1 Tax=uncultured Polaribacter sp. TaxID=174711 RepID=UPI00260B99C1|nr:hypothetical protein [uncultured Polaribacter sp.]